MGFYLGCAAFARMNAGLEAMAKIGIVSAFFTAAGAAFGIAFEAFGGLPR